MTNDNKCPGTNQASKLKQLIQLVHLDTVYTLQAIPRLQIVSDGHSLSLGMLGVLGARLETVVEKILGSAVRISAQRLMIRKFQDETIKIVSRFTRSLARGFLASA